MYEAETLAMTGHEGTDFADRTALIILPFMLIEQ